MKAKDVIKAVLLFLLALAVGCGLMLLILLKPWQNKPGREESGTVIESADESREETDSEESAESIGLEDSETDESGEDSEAEASALPAESEASEQASQAEESDSKLVQPTESWALNQGGTGTRLASSVTGGSGAVLKWTVWLNNKTFGKVLDFSTEGSTMTVSSQKVDFAGTFTVSVWMMAPKREAGDRILLASGDNGFVIYLDGNASQKLAVKLNGSTGLPAAGTALNDGKWHHILISGNASSITYYLDGKKVTEAAQSGTPSVGSRALTVGADSEGQHGFDGSLAQLRLFDTAITPEEATSTVLNAADNKAQGTRMSLKKGIAIDRRQYYGPEPLANEGQTVTENDIINCKNMGFDHVKLLLTPNHLINEDGSLKTGNMTYITKVLNYVKSNKFKCILCIHPEGDFKATYLGNLENFEKLIRWYGELAAYIGKHWDADTVALQLMTEPNNNTSAVSWSWMSDRMWGAVRNVLPNHTIITSCDDSGNLEAVKTMSPATDSNLIYSFTTYEPYTIGWYYYSTNTGQMNAWSYVHDIPYPVVSGVDYTDAIEYAISDVPASMKAGIRKQLQAYIRGDYDGQWTARKNHYNSLYNANWHKLRAKSLNDWSKKYGGNIHIMCVEFGCMDAETPKKLWKTAAPCFGISEETRIQFIKDMRSAFDTYGIGWDYWSYNEAHTIFEPSQHTYGASPSPKKAVNMFDYEMLTVGLGVTPKVKPTNTGGKDVKVDADWLVISKVEAEDGWFGSGLELNYENAPSGNCFLEATAPETGGVSVFALAPSPINVSGYSNGYLHLWIYVKKASALSSGQAELCSGGGPDEYETSWNLKQYIKKDGWNELYLPFSAAGKGTNPCNLEAVNYIRIYTVGAADVGIDFVYLCHEKPGSSGSESSRPNESSAPESSVPEPESSQPEAESSRPEESSGPATYVISSMSSLGGWFGTTVSKASGKAPDGGGYLIATGRDSAGSAVLACGFNAIDLSDYAGGTLRLGIYLADASLVTGGQIELTSSGGPDAQELGWDIAALHLKTGWNTLNLSLSSGQATGGSLDLSKLNYIRIYFCLTADSTVGISSIRIQQAS